MARYDYDGCPSDAWLLGFYHEEPEELYECDDDEDDDFYPDSESMNDCDNCIFTIPITAGESS